MSSFRRTELLKFNRQVSYITDMEAITALQNAYADSSGDENDQSDGEVSAPKEEELLHLKPISAEKTNLTVAVKSNPEVITKVSTVTVLVR